MVIRNRILTLSIFLIVVVVARASAQEVSTVGLGTVTEINIGTKDLWVSFASGGVAVINFRPNDPADVLMLTRCEALARLSFTTGQRFAVSGESEGDGQTKVNDGLRCRLEPKDSPIQE